VTALTSLLAPRSLALIGATDRADSFMSRPFRYLRDWGYPGDVHLVNPRQASVDGHPCLDSALEITDGLDLAVLMVRADLVAPSLEDCAAAGAGAAVVFSSGFGETGVEGRALQERVSSIARAAGMRVLGPNSQGLIHGPSRLSATFTSSFDPAGAFDGPAAYVGQSGALGGVVLARAREVGLTFSSWVTTGNQSDLTVTEVAAEVLSADAVRVCLLYLEDLPAFEDFLQLARVASSLGKHLVVLRAGTSSAGARMVSSHTGSIVSDGRAFELLCEAEGVELAADLEEFVAVAAGLAMTSKRPVRGRAPRLAVVSTSGGAGSLAADAAERCGIDVPPLANDENAHLTSLLPSMAASANPLDLTGQFFMRATHDLVATSESLALGSGADALLVALTNIDLPLSRVIAPHLARLADLPVPAVVCWLGPHDESWQHALTATAGRVPVFTSLTDACTSLIGLFDAPTTSGVDPVSVQRGSLPSGRIANDEGYTWLDEQQVRRPRSMVFERPYLASTVSVAATLHAPYAVKLHSPSLAHKTEAGGVLLDIGDDDVDRSVRQLFEIIDKHDLADGRVIVEEMAAPGVELVIGVVRDDKGYPPVLAIGFGGIEAELDPDVCTALAPVSPEQVKDLLGSLRRGRRLFGFRGQPGVDLDAVCQTVSRISHAVASDARIRELEINPLLAHQPGGGVSAVDFLATVEDL
jgi:acyl-CoA synthetase (NDP forming)